MKFVSTEEGLSFAHAVYDGRIDYYFRNYADAFAYARGEIVETTRGRVWRLTVIHGPATRTADQLAAAE